MEQVNGTLTERFWRKVVVDAETGCWTWTGKRGHNGYGYWHWDEGGTKPNTQRLVHRVVYTVLVGPIPDGLTIDHLCRNQLCVNPQHLEAVPQGENTRRGTGPVAINARKTHCIRGHDLSGPAVYVRPDGRGRDCRECKRAANARRAQEKASA